MKGEKKTAVKDTSHADEKMTSFWDVGNRKKEHLTGKSPRPVEKKGFTRPKGRDPEGKKGRTGSPKRGALIKKAGSA